MTSKVFPPLALVIVLGFWSLTKSPVTSSLPKTSYKATNIVRFVGSCDASAAIALDDKLFAVADDEDNVIRVYDATVGGYPIMQYDLSYKSKLQPIDEGIDSPTASPLDEMDIEAATELGGIALWMTSHGRDKRGNYAPDRFRFFGSSIDVKAETIRIVSPAVANLIPSLIQHPTLAAFQLQAASTKTPKAEGGLAIEGMTATPDDKLLLGFRNPVPEGHALVLSLTNPLEVLKGATPILEAPILLDLQNRSIRGMTHWNHQYWIASGHFGDEFNPALYQWSGPGSAAVDMNITLPSGFNPEAFFAHDASDKFMLLSDDGNVLLEGKPCKKLKNANQKSFRGLWVSPNLQ